MIRYEAFSFVEDTIKGTVLAMESDKAAGEIFHIGSDQEITIAELIKAVGEMMGYTENMLRLQRFLVRSVEDALTFQGKKSARLSSSNSLERWVGVHRRMV